jgi:hypothetical protein
MRFASDSVMTHYTIKRQNMPDHYSNKHRPVGNFYRKKSTKAGALVENVYVAIGLHPLLSSLCERELSQPISREAVTEGSTELCKA